MGVLVSVARGSVWDSSVNADRQVNTRVHTSVRPLVKYPSSGAGRDEDGADLPYPRQEHRAWVVWLFPAVLLKDASSWQLLLDQIH